MEDLRHDGKTCLEIKMHWLKNIAKIVPSVKVPQDTAMEITEQTDALNIEKKIIEGIQRAAEEEAFMGIGKYLDNALKEKVEEDE